MEDELRGDEYQLRKEQPFVKREDSARLAQSEPTKAEEISLVRKIGNRTRNLLQGLNSIESLTNRMNKDLLPSMLKAESEAKEKISPQGWLEYHLADLDNALLRSIQIHTQVERLVQATKTDKVGQ